jgi:hypothetical protein
MRREGGEGDASFVEFTQHLLGSDLLIHDQHAWVVATDLFPVVAEGEDLPGLGGFGDVCADSKPAGRDVQRRRVAIWLPYPARCGQRSSPDWLACPDE